MVATPGVIEAFTSSFILECLHRHMTGDYGDIDPADRGQNEQAILDGARIMSVYRQGTKVLWLITESDRSSTCALLPSEY
jgi:hypothetical protein